MLVVEYPVEWPGATDSPSFLYACSLHGAE